MAGDKLASKVRRRARRKEPLPNTERVEFITTGDILLNLAISGKGRRGGYARGHVINLVGDGSSGKTLAALEAAAHFLSNIKNVKSKIYPEVKNVRVVYNNTEGVMDFPIEKMYGQAFVDGVEWVQNNVMQDAGRDILSCVESMKSGDSVLWVIDSLDSCMPEEAVARTEEAIKKNKQEKDSFNGETQKYLSQYFFKYLSKISKGKDFTLIIISQVRENLNAGMFGKKYRRNGGKALDFFTHQVPWFYTIDKPHKTVKGKKVIYGTRVLAKCERNKVSKPYREAEFFIRFDYGLDPVQNMVNFLFGPTEKAVKWDGDEFKSKEEFIQYIQNNDKEDELALEVEVLWREIENAVKVERKPKFGG